jgi:hypothetical protein
MELAALVEVTNDDLVHPSRTSVIDRTTIVAKHLGVYRNWTHD